MRVAILAAFSLLRWLPQRPGQRADRSTVCHGNQQIRKIAELLFGRDIGRHLGVSNSDWTHFVARELTPRFPDGLTVSDTHGPMARPR